MKESKRTCDVCGGPMARQEHRGLASFGQTADGRWRLQVWRRKTDADGNGLLRLRSRGIGKGRPRRMPLMSLMDICDGCATAICDLVTSPGWRRDGGRGEGWRG